MKKEDLLKAMSEGKAIEWQGGNFRWVQIPEVEVRRLLREGMTTRRLRVAVRSLLVELELPTKYSRIPWNEKRNVRETYIQLQGGLCYHCKQPLAGKPTVEIQALEINRRLFPPRFFDHAAHLHHDHKTDMTLGAVHPICNAVLWQYHGE